MIYKIFVKHTSLLILDAHFLCVTYWSLRCTVAIYTKFDRYTKSEDISMDHFVLEFERHYNRIELKEMTLPEVVLAFKLLDASKTHQQDRQLVLTGAVDQQKYNPFHQIKSLLGSSRQQ